MRSPLHTLVPLLLSIPLASTAIATTPAKYKVAILSSSGASGNSIDDFGVVAGSYTLASKAVHASVWAFGRQIDLGTLGKDPGLSSRVQWPVKNYRGLVSGISLTDDIDPNKEGWSCAFFLPNPSSHVCLGFVWNPEKNTMRALPTLGGTR
jgi:hypothetical protein